MKTMLGAAVLAVLLLSPTRAEEGDAFKAWAAMSPQRQTRILRNQKRYQALSPESQARLREVYARFKDLTPESKTALIERFEAVRPPAEAPSDHLKVEPTPEKTKIEPKEPAKRDSTPAETSKDSARLEERGRAAAGGARDRSGTREARELRTVEHEHSGRR